MAGKTVESFAAGFYWDAQKAFPVPDIKCLQNALLSLYVAGLIDEQAFSCSSGAGLL